MKYLLLSFLILLLSCGEETTVNYQDDDDVPDVDNTAFIPEFEQNDDSAEFSEIPDSSAFTEIHNYEEDGYPVGKFVVKFEKDPQQIVVTNTEDTSKVIFSTMMGAPFVRTDLTKTEFKDNAGSFTISEDILEVCMMNKVTSVDWSKEKLVLTGNFTKETCPATFTLTFSEKTEKRLGFELNVDGASDFPGEVWRAKLIYSSTSDEGFFGFGEQFTFLNIKGRKLPILSQEQGIGRGQEPLSTVISKLNPGSEGDWHTSYAPVPHYITSKKNSLFLENYEYCIFDLTDPNSVTVEADSPTLKGQILFGSTIAELIETFTEYSGRMEPLPDWINQGAVIGLQGGTEKVNGYLDQFENYDFPIAGIWLQDWVGQRKTLTATRLWWNWELDKEHYPDWNDLVSRIKNDLGAKLLTYINPFITDVSKKDNFERNMFVEAKTLGYLLKDHLGQTLLMASGEFDAALVDLSNPDAVSWMKEIIVQNIIGSGADGWMADFSEATPYEAVTFSKESISTFHNRYVELWAKLNREVIEDNELKGKSIFFNRAGFTKSPGISTLFWLGDQTVSWDEHDGMKTAVTGLLSSGLSGFSLNHSDIGGYLSANYPIINVERTKELLLRWIELNAFTAVFRSHEGNNPASGGVQIYTDDETLSSFAKFAKIYSLLADYRVELMKEAHEKGLPVVRHPMIHYENDPEIFKLEYQFMLGEDFMIAPVLDKETSEVELYLPAGLWEHLWSDEVYGDENSGTYVKVEAPVGQPAVFFKKGSKNGENLKKSLSF